MDWVKIIEVLEQIIADEGKNKAGLSKILGVRSQYLSDLKSGKSKNPGSDFTLALINRLNVNPKWIETGEGEILLTRPDVSQSKMIDGNINALWNAGSVGNNNITLVSEPKSHPLTESEVTLRFYEIPLITKEHALHFNPDIEIPTPQAHLGEYPAVTMIAVPDRIRAFGTDLRAIVVFNNQMTPILNMGDIAIFEATGWGSDGIYLYRMNNDLHISHVKFDGIQFILTKEFKSKEAILYDEVSFGIIGRVRAVLKEV